MDKAAYTQMQHGNSAAGQMQSERQTIGSDLAYIETTLSGLRQHLVTIHDRIHGATPMEAPEAKPGSTALNHTVGRIKDEVTRLCELAYSLSESL